MTTRSLPAASVGVALALLAGLASGADAPPAAGPAKRPNILFIMSDDHAYQAISAYGHGLNRTPNIDRIAKEGMRFDRGYVTNSICGPCRAVILTGKYSHLNGFRQNNGDRFDGGQQNVAKLLQAGGYTTAVVGKWHLVTEPTGFDHYRILVGQGTYYNPVMITKDGRAQAEGYTTDVITDEAVKFLGETRDKSKPFFLMVHHKAPHRHWMPGPDHIDDYDDVTFPEPETLFDDYSHRASGAKDQAMSIAEDMTPQDLKLQPLEKLRPAQQEVWDEAYGAENAALAEAKLTGDDLVRWKYQRYMRDYLRCVASVDDGVGRVLDELDKQGLTDNTVVFYTSDQGFYLGEHGWFDKRWMYEESFRTPLLVRWPGVTKPGSVSNTTVMNLDLPETFLSIAGLDIPGDMQGASLAPILAGRAPEDWRTSMYYHYYEFPGPHDVPRHFGVARGPHKLIYYYQLGEWEMFDLEKDPREMVSVADDPAYAETRKELLAELTRLIDKYGDVEAAKLLREPPAKPAAGAAAPGRGGGKRTPGNRPAPAATP